MRAAWRLSTNALVGRRSRTALLIGAAAMSTALVSSVACALASLSAGLQTQVNSTLGRADLRVKEVAGGRFNAGVLTSFDDHPEIELLVARTHGAISLRNSDSGQRTSVAGEGVDPASEALLIDLALNDGRPVAGDGEIVLSLSAARELEAKVGMVLEVVRFGTPIKLEVVGILPGERMVDMRKPRAIVTREQLASITNRRGKLSQIQIVLRSGEDPAALAQAWGAELPPGVMIQTTERVTSGATTAIRANTFMFLLASVLAYIAAAFIVLTGLTTSVLERQKELAILRCIGSNKRTLAFSQLLIGIIIGGLGALVGIPLGIAIAWVMTIVFPDRLPAGLHVPPLALVTATAGSIIAGLIGSVWPALSAASVRPLAAMASQARAPHRRGIVLVTILGLVGIAWQLIIVGVPDDGAIVFWGYLTTGLPAMFVGYFLLGVPVSIAVVKLTGPVLAKLLRVPKRMLISSAMHAPYRNGFTAGALMVGLAMMTSIWTNGSALLEDWLDSIEFPDAFVNGWFGLDESAREAVEGLDFVTGTNAMTIYKIESEAFGISGIKSPPTNFIAFEPESFFEMAKLHWIAGDPEYAKRRLLEGGAVLVAKEFVVQRDGFGVGETLSVTHDGVTHDFEIVGAVSSPGLDIVSYYFDISKEYANSAISSIFGTRADLKRVFGSDVIHLLQIGISGDISDSEVTDRLRDAVKDASGSTALVVGSGREIKQTILDVGYSSMRVATIIAIGAMLIGCAGVSSVVVAGIEARQYEFGVLRSVGAQAGLIGRLVIGEVLLIALTACVLGTGLGIQGGWAGIRLYGLLAGIELSLRPPLTPIVLGWAILISLTMLTITPIVLRIVKMRVRELLGVTRG